jgi:two-component system cell cycle response regulator
MNKTNRKRNDKKQKHGLRDAKSLRRIRMLLIEDNPGDARLIKELLSEVRSMQCEVVSANRLEKGIELLGKRFFDVILLDLSLPDSQGLDTFEKIKKCALNMPVVLLTGLDDERTAAAAAQKGAEDYLVKGQVDSNLLGRSIHYAIERHRLQTELRNLSTTDELTGLYNRRGFFTLVAQQLKLAQRAQREMVLVYIDIDNMKAINDSLGHHGGDDALVKTARLLKETFRTSDIIARIGGDEYVIFAIECSQKSAELLTSRLQEKLDTFKAT